jgi:Bacterial antitoxin of type II TA system, VapB
MKTTINIPKKLLKSVMKRSGSKTIREAIVKALEAFERRDKLREITKHFGTFKDFMTQEDLRQMRGIRDKRHDLRRRQLAGRNSR